MNFFHWLEVNFLKTTIETLKFLCEFKKKLKIKASLGNLSINYINGYLAK